jgi:hypothetical protein
MGALESSVTADSTSPSPIFAASGSGCTAIEERNDERLDEEGADG